MPGGDGTGPMGSGPGTGAGMGMGQKQGRGRKGGFALVTGGNCVCPKCGRKASHQRGTPCNRMKCPDCGVNLTRER